MGEQEIINHESFWKIAFNRTSWGWNRFYWSELQQDNFITMSISNAETHRELSSERHYPTEQIIQIRMTSGQFAELITSLNTWSWVPCTIERLNWKRVEELPEIENKKEFTHRKFWDRMKEFAKRINDNKNEALEIIKKKTLSKDDQHKLSMNLWFIEQEITSNIPFFAKIFQQVTDEVVYEAKLEIENSIQHKISMLWLEVLHEQNKLLNK